MLSDIRTRLLGISSYVAGDGFLSLIGWKREGMENVLVRKQTGQKIVCVAIGQVINECLYCGPVGNFIENNAYPKPLDAFKYTFLLGRPADPKFATNFDQVVRTIKNCQGSVAMTDDHRHLVEVVGHDTVLRFSTRCWEKRALPDVSTTGVSEIPIDQETANWPIPQAQLARFNELKMTHRVIPLPIYNQNNEFVDCIRANAVLEDALVEVHFTVKHYAIRRDPGMDSFSGVVQQVQVLQPPPKKEVNPYHLNPRLGPVQLSADIVPGTIVAEDPSTSAVITPIHAAPTVPSSPTAPAPAVLLLPTTPDTLNPALPPATCEDINTSNSSPHAVSNAPLTTHDEAAGPKRPMPEGDLPPAKRTRDSKGKAKAKDIPESGTAN